MIGHVHFDAQESTNQRVTVISPVERLGELHRNKFVRIVNPDGYEGEFLGRITVGPYFHPTQTTADAPEVCAAMLDEAPSVPEAYASTVVEVQGELRDGRLLATETRPAPGATVYMLTDEEVTHLLSVVGDMLIGALFGYEGVPVALQSQNKSVLPRNVGIFGTVGSGKSNTSQVLIEEVARAGWAVIVLDVEGEYIQMDEPMTEEKLLDRLRYFGYQPQGLSDFQVFYPVTCDSDREGAEAFTLRTADYEGSVVAEIIETNEAERNALLEIIDYFNARARARVGTTELDELSLLLNAKPDAELPYHVGALIERASERSPHGTEYVDYRGLSSKLIRLRRSGVMDQPELYGIDCERLMVPGRVSIFDVSAANDIIKNMVTADLLRKVFAAKLAYEDAPRTLLVIEEAHTFISIDKVETMAATLQMVRDIARRGRKRWLGLSFISQQPGHLPAEIFELCNTRIVHNVKSIHNLDALMRSAGDVTHEMWAQCPMLGPGQAVVSSPQFKDPVQVNIRPAATRRKFVE